MAVGDPVDLSDVFLRTVGLNVYPLSLALPVGGFRQFIVRGAQDEVVTADDDTFYVSGDSSIFTVNTDGLVTAVGAGETTLTVVHRGAGSTVAVRVTAPQTGTVTVGEQGAIVQSSTGIQVAIGPGALPENTAVSVTTVTQANLGTPVPGSFTFAAAFDLNLANAELNTIAQIAAPVPASIPAGELVYFFEQLTLLDTAGTPHEVWMLKDSGIVGTDGIARTTSPPYPGFSEQGRVLVAQFDFPTSERKLDCNQYPDGLGVIINFEQNFAAPACQITGLPAVGSTVTIASYLTGDGKTPSGKPYQVQDVSLSDNSTTEITLTAPRHLRS